MKAWAIVSTAALLVSSHAQAEYVGYGGLDAKGQQKEKPAKVVPLQDLLSNNLSKSKSSAEVSDLRRAALSEIASSVGASNGLAFRMNQLKQETNKRAKEMDEVFNFRKMTIENGVLAPVLSEGLSNYSQESDDEVRIADKIYKIEAPAKFVSVYPTWRNYLRFSYNSFEVPNASYYPQNEAEKAVWDEAVKEGWDKGVLQADSIFEASYAKMERDYLGMIKYKILLAEGLITPTVIAKQNLGVTGGGKEMSINDQIFRISDHSALNPNSQEWKVEYPVTNQINGVLK